MSSMYDESKLSLLSSIEIQFLSTSFDLDEVQPGSRIACIIESSSGQSGFFFQ